MSSSEKEKSTVQSVERAFLILELLALHTTAGLTLTQLAKMSKLHKSTAYRLVNVLMQMGYVSQPEKNGAYRLTFKSYEIGSCLVNNLAVLPIARPYLDQLSQTFNEVAHLVVPDGNCVIYIHKSDSGSNTFRVRSQLGVRLPMQRTAVGKSILATMDEEEIAHFWETRDMRPGTDREVDNLEKLKEELVRVRSQGYATDNEENEPGVCCVAAAIVNRQGHAVAAMSVSAPTIRMDEQRTREIARQVMASAHSISVQCR